MRAQAYDTPATGIRDRAGEVAAEVANRLADPDKVTQLWDGQEPFDVFPGIGPIPLDPPYTLVEGLPGVAMLLAETGRQDPRARQRAHAHLRAAADRTPTTGPYGHGIFGGLAGLGTAAAITATEPRHYHRMLATVDSQVIRQTATLLHHNRHGCYWPSVISIDEETTGPTDTPPTRRVSSWCWGTPGIARALQLASRAVRRPEWEQTAIETQRAVFDHAEQDLRLPDAALCHGLSGLLITTDLIARDSGDPELATWASRTAQAVVGLFDPHTRFGYQHIIPTHEGTVVPDRPGFLNGAAGTALALHEYADPGPTDRRAPGVLHWTALLMLG